MIVVKCISSSVELNVEKRTPSQPMERAGLKVGNLYNVFSIYLIPESEIFRAHVAYVIELEPYKLTPIPAPFFEMIDDRVPPGWIIKVIESAGLALEPLEFAKPHLFELALEDDPESLAIIDGVRKTFGQDP